MKNKIFDRDEFVVDSTMHSDTQKSSRRGMSAAVVLLTICSVAFLGAGIYLYGDNVKKDNITRTLSDKIVQSENRYAELNTSYSSALAEIESYKGKNAALDSMVNVDEKRITGLKSSLAKDRKEKLLSEEDFKKQITDLNGLIVTMNAKVDDLQKQNTVLTVQKDSLGKVVTTDNSAITDLSSSNTQLTKKVTIASLLLPSDMKVTGIIHKSNGKESKTMKASKAQSLDICFNVPVNSISENGKKVFMVRLISPQGTVLALQDQGSGVLTSATDGTQKQYSSSAEVDYQGQAENVCLHWNQSAPFDKGQYTCEIYQDNYIVGTTNFEMK